MDAFLAGDRAHVTDHARRQPAANLANFNGRVVPVAPAVARRGWAAQVRDAEQSRLLFNADMQGQRNAHWQPSFLALRQRGMSTMKALVRGR